MNLLILIFLTVSVCWQSTCCKTIAAPDRIKTNPISVATSSLENKQFPLLNIIPGQNLIKVDPLNRTSRILGSLAFLAGLSVNSLTNAAKSNAKGSSNAEATQISPQIAAIYNPYSYLTHPYVFAAPLGIYPLWDPLRLSGHLQSLNLADNNKQTDLLNNDDEYVDENKKVENVKGSNEIGGEDGKFDEVDRISEEKMSFNSGCSVHKKTNMKLKEHEDIKSSGQNILTNIIKNSHEAISKNSTVQNSTGIYNYTYHPFFNGYYYDEYTQNINHIDLTTETHGYKYNDYEHINYNLPTYDKPVNFYSDSKYNYYSGDSDPSHQFHHEPEYFSNDFKRHLQTSESTPTSSNSDFKPMI